MSFASLLADPVFGIVLFFTVLLVIAIVNSFALNRYPRPRPARTQSHPSDPPMLSVLVPARNEEANIACCVGSLLAQDYPNFELLVLNDHSTDRTGEILAGFASGDSRLRLLEGAALPAGWLGKNWACHQLAQAAGGELLLFIDADTAHAPQTLSRSVQVLNAENIEMLTALPRQVVVTWGERLVVPVIYFCLLAFLPLPLAYRLPMPAFSAAIGQFMLFRRDGYERSGGYNAIQGHASDDLALARRVKANRLPWRMADGGALVSTRMYRNFGQAYEGLSKNLFAAFDYRLLPFLFAWCWMGYIFFRPPLELVYAGLVTPASQSRLLFCAIAIGQGLALWMLAILRFRFPPYLFLCYPAMVGLGVWIALRSAVLALGGRATWKGRRLERRKMRWL